MVTFRDRVDAGRQLVPVLGHLADQDSVVLGLPRGGVVVAAEVARGLGAPLDVLVVRKLGVPFQPELAMGAIGEAGAPVWNHDVLRMARITEAEQRSVEAKERVELERRVARYRAVQPRVPLDGRVAIVVDDGVATGATARTACQVAQAQGAQRIVLAAPVGSRDTIRELETAANEVVCLGTPEPFIGVGHWYDDFSQTTDDEVRTCLLAAQQDWVGRSLGNVTPASGPSPSRTPPPPPEGTTS